jgi:hypothetical protein
MKEEFSMKRTATVLVCLAVAFLFAASSAHAAAGDLALQNGRFQVHVVWQTTTGTTGTGTGTALTGDSGYFWFFDPANVELIIKVLDACTVNQHFWVFAGGLTNVGTTITVTDSRTGIVRTYNNPLSTPFRPIQDTAAFACP